MNEGKMGATSAAGSLGAIVISLRLGNIVTGCGFIFFAISSLSWTLAGYIGDEPSLVTQNVIFSAINALGIYRWLIAP